MVEMLLLNHQHTYMTVEETNVLLFAGASFLGVGLVMLVHYLNGRGARMATDEDVMALVHRPRHSSRGWVAGGIIIFLVLGFGRVWRHLWNGVRGKPDKARGATAVSTRRRRSTEWYPHDATQTERRNLLVTLVILISVGVIFLFLAARALI